MTPTIPEIVDDIRLREHLTELVEAVATNGPTKDCIHYVFEETMMTYFGRDFFKWWNANYQGE